MRKNIFIFIRKNKNHNKTLPDSAAEEHNAPAVKRLFVEETLLVGFQRRGAKREMIPTCSLGFVWEEGGKGQEQETREKGSGKGKDKSF